MIPVCADRFRRLDFLGIQERNHFFDGPNVVLEFSLPSKITGN